MEENKSTETVEVNSTETKPEEQKHTEDDVQKLMLELAKAKRERDKASTEAKEYKDKWKASLSEVEAASQEKAEREAAREEEFQKLLRENSINRLEKTYLAMGWTADEASRMATAETDNDFDGKVKIMAEVDARKKNELEKSFLANYGGVNVGAAGSVSYTTEQFENMTIPERNKLYQENPDEYHRLVDALKK